MAPDKPISTNDLLQEVRGEVRAIRSEIGEVRERLTGLEAGDRRVGDRCAAHATSLADFESRIRKVEQSTTKAATKLALLLGVTGALGGAVLSWMARGVLNGSP